MNGAALIFSPKGELSITYQYFKYFSKKIKSKGIEIDDFFIGNKFSSITANKEELDCIMDRIESADCIFVVSPVYAYCLPAEFKEFFDIVKLRNISLENKYVFSFISSGKVHDNIAIEDFNVTCKELNVKEYSGITLDMEPGNFKEIEDGLRGFSDYVLYTIGLTEYEEKPETITFVTDDETDPMIGKVKSVINNIDILSLDKYKVVNCRGDLACMFDECIFKNDDFNGIFEKLLKSDIIIFNFKGFSLSSSMRSMFARALSIGQHHESLPNKQLIFINQDNSSFINHWIEAYVNMQSCSLAGIITSSSDESEIKNIFKKAVWGAGNNYIPLQSFLKKGAFSIFEDITYKSGYVLGKDVKYLRSQGVRSFKLSLFSLFNKIVLFKPVKKIFTKKILSLMIAKHKKWLETE